MNSFASPAIRQRLRDAGILPTLQRLVVAAVMLPRPAHMTAEQVLRAARELEPGISRATVYAVVQLFARHGLIKELPMAGAATVYDSNTAPHHHMVNIDTGEVTDLPPEQLRVLGLPALDGRFELSAVDVIVRVRARPAALESQ